MPDSGRISRFVVPVRHASVPEARHLTRAALSGWGLAVDDQFVDTTVLIVTELVTNSVVHGAQSCGGVEILLCLRHGRLTVEVYDDHPRRPERRQLREGNEHGRGLNIIHQLASEWDGCVCLRSAPGRPGKSVVVVLDADAVPPDTYDAPRDLAVGRNS